MLEQWFFGFEQAFELVRPIITAIQSPFDPPEKAILFVMTIFMMLWFITTYLLLRGGVCKDGAKPTGAKSEVGLSPSAGDLESSGYPPPPSPKRFCISSIGAPGSSTAFLAY